MIMKLIRIMLLEQYWETWLYFKILWFFDILHIVRIVSSAWLEPENSSSNSSLTFIVSFCRFLGSGDPNTFFSRAQRSRMVYEILATTPFGKEKKGEVGIERMVDEGAYSGAFPLHDVSKMKNSIIEGQKIDPNW